MPTDRRKAGPYGRLWAGIMLATLAFAASPVSALAHTRERPTPETLWSSWYLDPFVLVGIVLGTWLYLRGTAAIWRRAGKGRGVKTWQVGAYLGGIATIALAKMTPLDAISASLFSAHMVQHMVLFLIAPILIVAGKPLVPFVWAIPDRWRKPLAMWWLDQPWLRTAWRGLTHPVTAWILYAGALWAWHTPALYDAALSSNLMHQLEHVTFLGAAVLFWWSILETGKPGGPNHGLAILMIFTTLVHGGVLGALLTFASSPLYASHLPYTAAWGLTPLEDQQLAGVIMWVPMKLWLVITAIMLLINWLRTAERSVRQWERAMGSAGTATFSNTSVGHVPGED